MTHENHNDPMPAIMARLAVAQCERLRRATEDAGEVIQRVSDFLDGNRDVVQSVERTAGENGRQAVIDGEREAAKRQDDDVCGMEHEVRATATRDELSHRSHGYSDGNGPRTRAIQSEAWSNY